MPKVQAPWEFVEKYYIDDLGERDSEESQWYLKWLKEIDGQSVLNFGCGPNFYDDIPMFGQLPKEVIGIDINKNNLEFLKKSNHPEIIRCKNFLKQNDIETELFLQDMRNQKSDFINRFDDVCAIGVLGNFNKEDTKRVIKNVYSYLKPGGKFTMVSWTDCRLPEEKIVERESFEWFVRHDKDIQMIGTLLQDKDFNITKHEVYTVANPDEYFWGKIYAYIAEK